MACIRVFYIHISLSIKYFSPCFGNVAGFRFLSEWEKLKLFRGQTKYDFERTVREG